MPNSPEAPGPVPSTVCTYTHCDDPAVVLVRSTEAPEGSRLCVPHAHDVASSAVTLVAAVTRGRVPALDGLRVTIEPLPVDYDELPIPFALVDQDELAVELDELHQAQA